MTSMLCLTIRFLDPVPQFHGRQGNGDPEWPPSPLRVYQALVAAAAGIWRNDDFEIQASPALRWLATQFPTIVAPKSTHVGVGYRMYVPHNVGDLMTSAWARGNTETSMSEFRVEKDVRPVTLPDDSAVHYLYPLADPKFQHFDVIRTMARALTHLGWGIDVVSGNAEVINEHSSSELEGETWRPDDGSALSQLRVAVSGTLGQLMSKHQAFLGRISSNGFVPVPPITAFRVVGYRPSSVPVGRSIAAFLLLKPDASGMRSFDTVRRTRDVAGVVRHAVATVAERQGWTQERINTFVHGKTVDGSGPVVGDKTPDRFQYLPIPTVNQKLGRIESVRRVLITAPSTCRAQADWAQRALAGEDLVNDNGESVALLNVLPKSDWVLRQYLQASEVWATATPVILPGHDDFIMAKAERLLKAAFEQAGFDAELMDESELNWRKVPFIPGADIATRYCPPANLARFPRYHVAVRFPHPVAGPIAVGSGRFRGFGLFVNSQQLHSG